MLRNIIIGSVALAVSTLAFAAQPDVNNVANTIIGLGPYVGIQAGIGGLDTKFPSDKKAALSSYSERVRKGAAARLFAGYLWGNNRLQYGAEIGVARYPNNIYKIMIIAPEEEEPIQVNLKLTYQDYDNIDLLGVVRYTFPFKMNLFAKAGAAYVTQKAKATGFVEEEKDKIEIPVTDSYTEHRELLKAAVGIGCNMIKNLEVHLTYSHIFGATLKVGNPDVVANVDALMAGATWYFLD
ncbi:MAG: outer membrane beta-barrel protein [Gammaproteobacteria bacterium]|nr:outer membrane beta-barrel protein [Gammaproteobacteria bacterium]